MKVLELQLREQKLKKLVARIHRFISATLIFGMASAFTSGILNLITVVNPIPFFIGSAAGIFIALSLMIVNHAIEDILNG